MRHSRTSPRDIFLTRRLSELEFILDQTPVDVLGTAEVGFAPPAQPGEPHNPTKASFHRALVLGFELADHSLDLVVEGGEDLVGVLFRVVKSQAADREIDDFMTGPRSSPG
jgi:hypothetical protein